MLGKLHSGRATVLFASLNLRKASCAGIFVCLRSGFVIPNGVNKADLKVEPYPKGLKVILYVGRLEEYKGVQYAIRALPFLPWHRLHVIGKGPYKEALLQEAKAAGVRTRWRS